MENTVDNGQEPLPLLTNRAQKQAAVLANELPKQPIDQKCLTEQEPLVKLQQQDATAEAGAELAVTGGVTLKRTRTSPQRLQPAPVPPPAHNDCILSLQEQTHIYDFFREFSTKKQVSTAPLLFHIDTLTERWPCLLHTSTTTQLVLLMELPPSSEQPNDNVRCILADSISRYCAAVGIPCRRLRPTALLNDEQSTLLKHCLLDAAAQRGDDDPNQAVAIVFARPLLQFHQIPSLARQTGGYEATKLLRPRPHILNAVCSSRTRQLVYDMIHDKGVILLGNQGARSIPQELEIVTRAVKDCATRIVVVPAFVWMCFGEDVANLRQTCRDCGIPIFLISDYYMYGDLVYNPSKPATVTLLFEGTNLNPELEIKWKELADQSDTIMLSSSEEGLLAPPVKVVSKHFARALLKHFATSVVSGNSNVPSLGTNNAHGPLEQAPHSLSLEDDKAAETGRLQEATGIASNGSAAKDTTGVASMAITMKPAAEDRAEDWTSTATEDARLLKLMATWAQTQLGHRAPITPLSPMAMLKPICANWPLMLNPDTALLVVLQSEWNETNDAAVVYAPCVFASCIRNYCANVGIPCLTLRRRMKCRESDVLDSMFPGDSMCLRIGQSFCALQEILDTARFPNGSVANCQRSMLLSKLAPEKYLCNWFNRHEALGKIKTTFPPTTMTSIEKEEIAHVSNLVDTGKSSLVVVSAWIWLNYTQETLTLIEKCTQRKTRVLLYPDYDGSVDDVIYPWSFVFSVDNGLSKRQRKRLSEIVNLTTAGRDKRRKKAGNNITHNAIIRILEDLHPEALNSRVWGARTRRGRAAATAEMQPAANQDTSPGHDGRVEYPAQPSAAARKRERDAPENAQLAQGTSKKKRTVDASEDEGIVE